MPYQKYFKFCQNVRRLFLQVKSFKVLLAYFQQVTDTQNRVSEGSDRMSEGYCKVPVEAILNAFPTALTAAEAAFKAARQQYN